MKITMIGCGYVGLVTGACLAETGSWVTCVDVNQDKVAELNAGKIPIFERGLKPLIDNGCSTGRLSFSSDIVAAIKKAEVLFVAVGTPTRRDGAADLSAVDRVAEKIATEVKRECVVVLKSTVPVGTNDRVRRIVKDAPHKIHVVSNPEFLKEGDAIGDFMRPDRIVVGLDEDDAFAKEIMIRLYHPFNLGSSRIVWMDPASAELTKYVSNTMLAMRISFMNEVAMLCEKVGANIRHVRLGVGSDSRIGPKFLYAGPGFGGSYFPKDVKALVHTAEEWGTTIELAASTDRVNERHKGVLARKIKTRFNGDLRDVRVAMWGLAFKPRTDDVREAPALTTIEVLLSEGAQIVAHDPQAGDNVRKLYGERLRVVDDAYEALTDADVLVLHTEWREYQNPDFERIAELMSSPILIDGRNIWATYDLGTRGFVYEGVGITH